MEALNQGQPPYRPPAVAAASAAAVSGTDRHPLQRRAALLTGVALGLAAGFAGLYFSTLPIFLKPIAQTFGWGRADTSGAIVMSMLGSALGAPLIGRLMDRVGAVRLIGLSMLLFAASLGALSMLPNRHALFALVSFGTGLLAVGTAPAGYLAVLSQAFNGRLGLALSLSMVGIGVGAMSFPQIAQSLIGAYGWRAAYQGLAAIALAGGTLACGLLVYGQRHTPAVAARAEQRDGSTLAEALHDRRFWTLAAVLFAATAAGLGAVVHLSALLTDRGLSAATAARLAAFPGIGLMVGRLLSGVLMDLLFAPLLAAGAFLLGAVGLAALAFDAPSSSTAVLAASALLFGFALGMEGDFAAFAVRRYFGTRSFGVVYGLMYAAYALGGVVGPIAFGFAFDRLGSYDGALLLALAAFVAAAAAVLTLGPYRWAKR